MNEAQILAGVRQVIRDKLRIAVEVSPGTELLAELRLDSLQQLTLVVELENHFRVCFDPGDEAGITTVDSVVGLIGRRLSRGAAAD